MVLGRLALVPRAMLVAMMATMATMGADSWPAQAALPGAGAPAAETVPVGLTVTRSGDGRAQMVVWTGSGWQATAASPETTLSPLARPPECGETQAISPDGRLAAVVRPREHQTNAFGAGELAIVDARTGARHTTVTPAGALDYSAAWAHGGRALAFLRLERQAWSDDAAQVAAAGESLAAQMLVYDLETGRTTMVLPDAAPRRQLLVPAAGGTAVMLEALAGVRGVYAVDLDSGRLSVVRGTGTATTAIGWTPDVPGADGATLGGG